MGRYLSICVVPVFKVIECCGLISILMMVAMRPCVAAGSGRRPDPPPSISNVDSGVGYGYFKSLSQVCDVRGSTVAL